ncbi:MCP four helix bundle domain-containing protein [Oxalobacteraceae bacterium]|nr:MCP four helix bundle domain-containing protein [Oxalobacteraceae bacterium]
MHQLKISTRIAMLIATILLLLAAIAVMGLKGMGDANAGLQTVYEDRTLPMGQLLVVQRLILRNRVAMNNTVALDDPVVTKANLSEIESNASDISRTWAAYVATRLTPKEAAMAKAFQAARETYLQQVIRPAGAAMRANDMDSLRQLLITRDEKYYGAIQKEMVALTELQVAVAKQEFEAAQARYGTVRAMTIGLAALSLAFAVLFAYFMVRGIARSLQAAVNTTVAIAQGDLSSHIDTSGKDEVGELLRSLSAMQGGLIKVVGTVREGSESVASASTQIAQGNMDLSGRTESQASALEQTAASMEELSSTVKQNADNAREASQLARSASQVAEQGGQVVMQVVDTMKGISESSRKMSDIIGVIDSIAFQTNILALNAAVEAARAGEQGRGFAVVATEVRSLASRSAEAAREIKQLINDSVGRVEQGTALADRAGETMSEVVGAIRRVTGIMAEISSASVEQSAGVNQMGEAVTQMDEDTQQNAALVEEMAAAAAALNSLARELVQVVAVFKLDQGTGAAVVPIRAMPRKAAAAKQAVPGRQLAAQGAHASHGADWEEF